MEELERQVEGVLDGTHPRSESIRSIVEDPEKTARYKPFRGRGGFVRASWDEINEIVSAANLHTIEAYGPDRIAGFSPIPAMSMVSYASGARYVSLLGGTMLSFYDWYADLPPASPQSGTVLSSGGNGNSRITTRAYISACAAKSCEISWSSCAACSSSASPSGVTPRDSMLAAWQCVGVAATGED